MIPRVLVAFVMVASSCGCLAPPKEGAKNTLYFDEVKNISWDSSCGLANVTVEWLEPTGGGSIMEAYLRARPNATLNTLASLYKNQAAGSVEETYTGHAESCGGWFATSVTGT